MKIENNFEKKAAEIEILSYLINCINEKLKDITTDYQIVGKSDTQATDWRTGELKWEDDEHTIPCYESKWDYVDVPEDELEGNNKLLVDACKSIAKKLEKLI